jgi:hypothetical protein
MDKKYRNGFIVGVIGILVIGGYLLFHQRPPGVGCAITSAGIADMAHAFAEGNDDTKVIALLGAAAATPECQSLVKNLYHEQTTPQQITLTDSQGTTKQSITESQLITDASQPAPGSVERIISCWGSYLHSDLLDEWCVKGIINP